MEIRDQLVGSVFSDFKLTLLPSANYHIIGTISLIESGFQNLTDQTSLALDLDIHFNITGSQFVFKGIAEQ